MLEKQLLEEETIFERQEELKGNIFTDTNKMWLSGILQSAFTFSHEIYCEKFYNATVKVLRLNNVTEDIIPIQVSDRLIHNIQSKDLVNRKIEVGGSFRSYNRKEGYKNHLEVFLFANYVNIDTGIGKFEYSEGDNQDKVYLNGFICKQPVYRNTPLGREITDLLVAVNRPYGKTDYIPCIVWQRNARYASCLSVGAQIELLGRVQSREYKKLVSPEGEVIESRTAYEISCSKFNLISY